MDDDIDYTIVGAISGIGLPFDLNDEEADEAAIELAKALARKRPCGFAPWPDDNKQEGN